jgi:antitoxin MazE
VKVAIRSVGKAKYVIIPKAILEQVGLADAADLQVKKGLIEFRPSKRNPREGWAADSQRIARFSDDVLVWP